MSTRFLPLTETELRNQIADQILRIDLSDAKEISSDYFAGAIRMRLVASVVARKGLPDES